MQIPIQKYVFNGQEYTFSFPIQNKDDDHTFTILIGKNGCGKSRILSSLIKDSIHKKNTGIQKIIAITNIANDSFPFINQKNILPKFNINNLEVIKKVKNNKSSNNNYFYYGKRHADNFCNEGRYSIFFNILKVEERENIIKAFEYLGFEPNFRMDFRAILTTSNSKYKTIQYLYLYKNYKSLFEKFTSANFNKKIDYFYDSYIRINKSLFNEEEIETHPEFSQILPKNSLLSLFNISELMFLEVILALEMSSENFVEVAFEYYANIFLSEKCLFSENSFHINYDLMKTRNSELIKIITTLSEFGLIKIINVFLTKLNSATTLNYRQISSGEQSSLNLLLGIAGNIQNNSLICIDEPEVNLHPEWQVEFILTIQNIFNHIKNCHFVIATHSPQIVSGLKTDKGYILDVEQNKTYKSKQYTHTSVDSQLVELFHSPGYNNEYILKLCFRLISIIKDQENFSDKDKEFINQLKDARKSLRDDDSSLYLINQVLALVESQS